MCLSIPVKIISIDGDMAEVSAGGAIFRACIQMIDGLKPGDYVLMHAGFAIQKINETEAADMLSLFEELRNATEHL